MKHWPDNICGGKIEYRAAANYSGFALCDTEHGIPTIGAVSVQAHNYPGQTEEIARRLVACWNAFEGLSIEEIERCGGNNS